MVLWVSAQPWNCGLDNYILDSKHSGQSLGQLCVVKSTTVHWCVLQYSTNMYKLQIMVRRASRLSTRNREEKNQCEQIVSPLFQFDHLLTQVPKYLYFIHGSESEKNYTLFWVWLQWRGLSQKRPENLCFWFRSVVKMGLNYYYFFFFAKPLLF